MLLTIDIGNTQIVFGIFDEDTLLTNWRFSSNTLRTEDECWAMLQSLSHAEDINLLKVRGSIISSGVPNLTKILSNMVITRLQHKPVIVNSTLNIGIKIHYDDPTTVGADRLCNAIAGFSKYGGPVIIVDFGTATTFDVISSNGDYLGGVIATGIETSLQALSQRAARLMRVPLIFPEKIIGTTTEASMQSGLMFGTVELIEGLVNKIKMEIQGEAEVLLTGGLAPCIAKKLPDSYFLEPQLTLLGLKIIYDRTTRA